MRVAAPPRQRKLYDQRTTPTSFDPELVSQAFRYEQDEDWGPVLITCDVPVGLWRRADMFRGFGVGMATAEEVRFPLDPSHLLVLHSKLLLNTTSEEGLLEGAGDEFKDAIDTVLGWCHRWLFMHPENPAFESLKIPEMNHPAPEAKRLISMAENMRRAHEVPER